MNYWSDLDGADVDCPFCDSDGEIAVTGYDENDNEVASGYITCPHCGGSGTIELELDAEYELEQAVEQLAENVDDYELSQYTVYDEGICASGGNVVGRIDKGKLYDYLRKVTGRKIVGRQRKQIINDIVEHAHHLAEKPTSDMIQTWDDNQLIIAYGVLFGKLALLRENLV